MKVKREMFSLQVPRDPNRSGGLHLSEILRDLALKSGVLDMRYAEQGDMDANVGVHIGLAFEEYLAATQHKELIYHPGELNLDGIAMSPDAVGIADTDELACRWGVDPESWVLSEFKTTKKSSRDFEESLRLRAKKVLLWLWQIQAYRHALNQYCEHRMECNVARLHVLFLSGNYSKDSSDPRSMPHYDIYQLRFTPEELTQNWSMIVSHAECMRQEGRI